MNGDLAQILDDIQSRRPGLSFTFLVNEALEKWFCTPTFDQLTFDSNLGPVLVHVKKSANIQADLIEKIEEMKNKKPGFNATLIINQALWLWSKNPTISILSAYTESDVDEFLDNNSELMDKLAE